MNAREVVLVVGPPGSGKSTHAAATGLLHLEREQFPSDAAFTSAVREATAVPDARVAVVRCCPTVADQERWSAMIGATSTAVLATPLAECQRRIETRRRPGWLEELAAAEEWHRSRDGTNPRWENQVSDTGTPDAPADTGETAPPPPKDDDTDWEAEAKRLKALMRKVEDQNKANVKKLEAFEQASMSEQEKAVNAARVAAMEEARQATLKDVGWRLVDAEVRTAASGRGVDVDALLEGLDRSRFLGDDLEPDTAGIRAWVDRVTPKRDASGFDIGQGARGNGEGSTDLAGSDFERGLVKAVGGVRRSR